MDLEKCEVITTAEFGSTYQGTADEYSDQDYFSLVVQPLEHTIFRNSEKSAKHVGDHRYYPIERFITLIGKGSFDNLLMLCAQLEQAEKSRFNQDVLKLLYFKEEFSGFVAGQLKPLTYSVIGNLDRLMKKDFLSGKDYIKFLTFSEHLDKLDKVLSDTKPLYMLRRHGYNCDELCKVNLGDTIKKKREDVAMVEEDWKRLQWFTEQHIKKVKLKLKDRELAIKDYEKANQERIEVLKSRTTDFLVWWWQ